MWTDPWCLRCAVQGGVWPPTSYMVLRGLTAAGQDDVAADIGLNYHTAVTQVLVQESSGDRLLVLPLGAPRLGPFF